MRVLAVCIHRCILRFDTYKKLRMVNTNRLVQNSVFVTGKKVAKPAITFPPM